MLLSLLNREKNQQKGTAMSSTNPKYLWGKENKNWTPPSKADEGDSDLSLSNPADDFSTGSNEDEKDEFDLMDDSRERFVEAFNDLEGPEDMYIDTGDGRYTSADDYSFDYSQDNYEGNYDGIPDDAYLVIPFSSGDEYLDKANAEDIQDGYMDGLPDGSYVWDGSEVYIPLNAWDEAARGEGENPESTLSEIKDIAESIRSLREDDPVMNSMTYENVLSEEAEKQISDTDIRVTISDMVDSDREDYAYEHHLEDDDPEVEEYADKQHDRYTEYAESRQFRDELAYEAIERYRNGEDTEIDVQTEHIFQKIVDNA